MLDVGVFVWSSARAGLRRFFFIENRAEVHEACGSLGPVSWVGLSRPQEAAATVLVVLAPPRKKPYQEQHALTGNTSPSAASSSCGTIPGTGSRRHSDGIFVVLPLRGAAALDPQPRMRLGRKTSVSQLPDAHEQTETRDARYPGREDVHHQRAERASSEGDCQLRAQLAPTESTHGFGDTVSRPFCPWLQLKNGKGCLYMHLVPPRARKGHLAW